MSTLIRQFPSAQFSGSLILDLEPPIAFPAATLGAYRLRNSAAYSAAPRAGGWPAVAVVDTGADPTFTPYSAQTNAGKTLGISGQNMPSGNLTILTVSRQRTIAGAGSLQWLGGSAVNGASSYGVVRSKDSLNAALSINGEPMHRCLRLAVTGGRRSLPSSMWRARRGLSIVPGRILPSLPPFLPRQSLPVPSGCSGIPCTRHRLKERLLRSSPGRSARLKWTPCTFLQRRPWPSAGSKSKPSGRADHGRLCLTRPGPADPLGCCAACSPRD